MREKQRKTWSKMQMREMRPGAGAADWLAGWPPPSLTSCSGAIIYFNSAAAAM